MTKEKGFKKRVRARMGKTGESYTAARAQIDQHAGDQAPEVTPAATRAYYPFERFTERAKHVLTMAQEEAERSGHSYIGTEHLLIALIRESEGLAAQVLAGLGVQLDDVRAQIHVVLGRNERIFSQEIVPTSRVKKVVEISFEESRRMGNNYVGTEHILLALLIEGEGIAAHVLSGLGASLDVVRPAINSALEKQARSAELADLGVIDRRLQERSRQQVQTPQATPASITLSADVLGVIEDARRAAAADKAEAVGFDHLLTAVARVRSRTARESLKKLISKRRTD